MKRLALFCLGALVVLLSLESAFRVLPVSTATRSGYYVHPLIVTSPPRLCFIAATGWDLKNPQRNCANNDGFIASRDFVPDPHAIALIGDSFVEASMLPTDKRLADQLETRLGGRPVYALGGPGSNLLDYAERARFAAEYYGIRTFVFVLERSDVKQALCGSGNIHGPCVDPKSLQTKVERLSESGTLKRVFRESALAQYLFSQIRVDLSKLLAPLSSSKTIRPPTAVPLGDNAASFIVSLFRERLEPIGKARYLFLIDADRQHLKTGSYAVDAPELQSLLDVVNHIDGRVIDPTDAFRAHLAETGKKLEVGPYDRHWNAEAINILATLVAEKLTADGADPSSPDNTAGCGFYRDRK